MGEDSGIQWTKNTFNPWVGCQRVSPGCEHCYAEAYDKRVGGGVDPGDKVKKLRWGPKAPRVRTSVANWRKPVQWNKAAAAAGRRDRVFCASLSDVFEDRSELAPWRRELFELIDATPSLDWLLLTKRPENIARLTPPREVGGYQWPRLNVWLGTTVEDQQRANERIPALLAAPAVVHFLSMEPLIEPVDLRTLPCSCMVEALEGAGQHSPKCNVFKFPQGIDWVIVGGESGGSARPFDLAWARAIVRQCRGALAAPFVKQLGSRPVLDRARLLLTDSHGGDPDEWPEDLRVREFPTVRR